jgi:two-component system, OmpR family, sensor histidine kinase TctE
MRLRSHLLRWLLIPLFVLWALGFRIGHLRSLEQANRALDRTLLGSALAIAERSSVRDGMLSVDLPYAALEMLESRAQDRIFYKVSCVQPPLVITGHEDLPAPASAAAGEQPRFEDLRYNGEAVRMVSLQRPLYDPAYPGPLLVQVAETTAGREGLSRRILLDAAATQLMLIGLAAALIAFGVRRGLDPLRRLRDEVRARDPGDLNPIDTAAVPREVVPLIEAINSHTQRQAQLNEAHRQFIADASHQLKTPLTVLKTQAALALQQADPQAARAIVSDIHDSTDATSRVIQQLLALARSEAAPVMQGEEFDLVEAARGATFDLLPQALARGIELGFDEHGPVNLQGQPLLLRELVANLVDNAIRYTPRGGHVNVSVARDANGAALLQVEDDGPGIAPEQRSKVFDRFYRVQGSNVDGAGLGLAIVKQIAQTHGARIELHNAAAGSGLRVALVFAARPAAPGGTP